MKVTYPWVCLMRHCESDRIIGDGRWGKVSVLPLKFNWFYSTAHIYTSHLILPTSYMVLHSVTWYKSVDGLAEFLLIKWIRHWNIYLANQNSKEKYVPCTYFTSGIMGVYDLISSNEETLLLTYQLVFRIHHFSSPSLVFILFNKTYMKIFTYLSNVFTSL